ncbi:MAG: Nif3-like dinuclear metal center hexameric protein [Actinomycetota bacterium]|nr:Nif3-like dinuclear metal center hexameric protein [Actinomycetota bacterium]
MKLKELAVHLDKIFNRSLALDWDRTGLQIGNIDKDIKKILVALDLTGGVVDEAINSGSELIITHHPLLFNSVDTILSSDAIGKEILKLIENKIALYCAHTNYDSMAGGLSDLFAEALGLTSLEVIEEQSGQWYKFVVFAPRESEEKIRQAICRSGGGKWRNYSCCTFNVEGKGTFIPEEGSKPYTGKTGRMSYVDEVRIECIVDEEDLDGLVGEVLKAHPYEEPAYDIYKIENEFKEGGTGRVGKLPRPMKFKDFAGEIKKRLEIDGFGWMCREGEDRNIKDMKISRVATVCGSANSLTDKLATIDCDAIVVGEISYHNALRIVESMDCEGAGFDKIEDDEADESKKGSRERDKERSKIIITVGHGNSEKLAISGISGRLEDFFKENKIKIDIQESKLGRGAWRYQIE